MEQGIKLAFPVQKYAAKSYLQEVIIQLPYVVHVLLTNDEARWSALVIFQKVIL